MARKLPWATGSSAGDTKTSSKHETSTTSEREKRRKIVRPGTPEVVTRRSHKRAMSRSPSTSPVRPAEPAPQVEPMRSGPHADDQYMMVEDEFEAVAKQYTAHLHAAEYARLKRKAKETPPKPLPDFYSGMPQTTKLNLERQHLLSRQSTTLSDMGKRGAHQDMPSDNDAEDVEQKINDLWSGTSLAGLMGESTQAKTSLVGLQRMNSSTRAANGFGRGDTESSPRKKRRTISDIFTDEGGDVCAYENEVDVSRDNWPVGTNKQTRKDPSRGGGQTEQRDGVAVKAEVFSSANRRSRIDDIDGFEPDLVTKIGSTSSRNKNSEVRSPSTHSSTYKSKLDWRKPKDREGEKAKDRKARLDEVPVFLV